MPVTYDRIASTTLGSTQSSITLSGISQSYTDLRVSYRIFLANNGGTFNYTINGVTTTSYAFSRIFTSLGGGSGNYGQGRSWPVASVPLGSGPTANQNTDNPYVGTIDLMNYTSSGKKGMMWSSAYYTLEPLSANSSRAEVWRGYALANDVSTAITSITFGSSQTNSFLANSMVTIYGILRA